MRTIIVIPARYASTRYPGKPLSKLKGREAILWTLDAAKSVANVDAVYVATDDDRIRAVVERADGRVLMTSPTCCNGTERVAEAAAQLGLADDSIVVNLQGDAPLTPPWFVAQVVADLERCSEADVATPALRCDPESLQRFQNDRRAGRVGATTVVFDRDRKALYFSKEIIPYTTGSVAEPLPVYHHVGLYAYRVRALVPYASWGQGPLETVEQLEQLRFLENGKRMLVSVVDDRGHRFWELNNPEDIAILEDMIDLNNVPSG